MAISGTVRGVRRGGSLALLLVATGAIAQTPDPLPNPVPERIVKGQLRVAVEPFVRAPASAMEPGSNAAYARIQYLLPVPGPGARLAFIEPSFQLKPAWKASGRRRSSSMA